MSRFGAAADSGLPRERLKDLSEKPTSSPTADRPSSPNARDSASFAGNRKQPAQSAFQQGTAPNTISRTGGGPSFSSAKSVNATFTPKEIRAYEGLVESCKKMDELGNEGISRVKAEGHLSTGRMEQFVKTCSDIKNKSRRSVITSMRKHQIK
ncbi:hypothetical protein [Candidatus Korobacter versatilis]|nr:hypothetical protein [Candidatus Koribacter versatilis]